jgi:hypothetical protein
MDRLSVHFSKKSRERYDELGIEYIYNSSYSPAFNGIEEIFN